jgi:hypothetical protein
VISILLSVQEFSLDLEEILMALIHTT